MEENFGNTEPGEGPDQGDRVAEGEGRLRENDASDEEITQRRRLLVAELRNGGREQAVGRLKRPGSESTPAAFCCLGVACEIAIANGLELGPWSRDGQSPVYGLKGELGSTTCLPESARDWYRFGTQDPGLLVPQALLDSAGGRLANIWKPEVKFNATALNDDYGLTLAQIGVCFQYTFLREDWEAERG